MRNRRLGRKLGVKTKHRKAMLRNMATELFRHEKIRTTDAKAKELKRVADKIVTLAKNSAGKETPDGGLSLKRRIFGYITDKDVARKIFTEIAERYKQRPGGYSRITSLGYRRGDRTPVSQIELVTEDCKLSPKKNKTRKSNLPSMPPKDAEQKNLPQDSAPAQKEDKKPNEQSGEKPSFSPAGQTGEKETEKPPESFKPEKDGE